MNRMKGLQRSPDVVNFAGTAVHSAVEVGGHGEHSDQEMGGYEGIGALALDSGTASQDHLIGEMGTAPTIMERAQNPQFHPGQVVAIIWRRALQRIQGVWAE